MTPCADMREKTTESQHMGTACALLPLIPSVCMHACMHYYLDLVGSLPPCLLVVLVFPGCVPGGVQQEGARRDLD